MPMLRSKTCTSLNQRVHVHNDCHVIRVLQVRITLSLSVRWIHVRYLGFSKLCGLKTIAFEVSRPMFNNTRNERDQVNKKISYGENDLYRKKTP